MADDVEMKTLEGASLVEGNEDSGDEDGEHPPVLEPEIVKVDVGQNGAMAPIQTVLHVLDNMEHNPPEGRKLFFDAEEGGKRFRIDYVLAWSSKEKSDEKLNRQKCRDCFEENLRKEGLKLEYDIKEGREVQYVKIHATWEVLTRYAEIMKVRMPMKEVPEDIQTVSFWEMFTEMFSRVLRPFDLDEEKVPPITKKFTCIYQRDKEYLFAIPKEEPDLFFPHATRSRIVDYILRRKMYTDESKDTFAFGINRLRKNNVYTAAYPLHEGSWKPWTKPSIRRLLYEHWANWKNFYKVQPLNYIRSYFGEKVGLYFAWLGFYTWMLIPASLVGLAVFIYGVVTINDNIIASETCDSNDTYLMCPQCDLRCPYWSYNVSCTHARASHMFDNGATVFFAVFMSLWGTIFLEFWKREQAGIQFQWNLTSFVEEEEPPRPEYLMRLQNCEYRKKHVVSGVEEPYLPFWRRRVPVYVASLSVMLFLVAIAIGCVIGVIVYRMAVLAALYLREEEIFYKNASMVTTATSACINLIVIFVLNFVYEFVAYKLTDWECLRTQSEHDNSLTIKLYLLQFVNYYSSIIYIAFFKGRFVGRPGSYNTLFNARQEECQAGGCLIELAIQLAIIFVGKQLIQNNLMEIVIPRVTKFLKKCFMGKDSKKKNRAPWEKDYILIELGSRGLFNEYLEMLLQFGFVTIFVAAFPLAPLFALMNNILEIRADANKFVTQLQRPMATQARSIGIWYEILYAVSRLAVFSNACIIAFTSSFIHRFVYEKHYSEDGSLTGYLNHSLAIFNISDFPPGAKYMDSQGHFTNLSMCRYMDFREPPTSPDKYEYTREFWHILAAQFIFVVVFENFVILTTSGIAYLIPDMPRKLREQLRREAYLTNEIVLKTELEIARGEDSVLSDLEMRGIRRRVMEAMEGGIDKPGEEYDSEAAHPMHEYMTDAKLA